MNYTERLIIALYRTAQVGIGSALVVGAWMLHPVLGVLVGYVALICLLALLGW